MALDWREDNCPKDVSPELWRLLCRAFRSLREVITLPGPYTVAAGVNGNDIAHGQTKRPRGAWAELADGTPSTPTTVVRINDNGTLTVFVSGNAKVNVFLVM